MPHRESRLSGRARDVRSEHDVLHAQELLAHRRLVLEDVEGCAGNRSGLQRGDERRLVDDLPARSVDEHGRRLHGGERGRVEQMPRLRRQRAVQGHDIRGREQREQVVAAPGERRPSAVRLG